MQPNSFIYEKYYVHNIFTINYKWLVVIGSNLNLLLKSCNQGQAPTMEVGNHRKREN